MVKKSLRFRTLDKQDARWLECASKFLAIEKEHALRALQSVDGPIAQSVEQLAFNQWVAGSSPARLKFLPHSDYKHGYSSNGCLRNAKHVESIEGDLRPTGFHPITASIKESKRLFRKSHVSRTSINAAPSR